MSEDTEHSTRFMLAPPGSNAHRGAWTTPAEDAPSTFKAQPTIITDPVVNQVVAAAAEAPRRRLAAVEGRTIAGDPDGIHLSVEEWNDRWREWPIGMTLCGRSAEQGALPAGTAVTCADCEGYRDSYERALAGRPTAEQEQLASLRRKLARIEQMATAWEQKFPENIRTAAVVEALRIVIQEQS